MSCKCRICGASEVLNEGDICELCALDHDDGYYPQPSPDNGRRDPNSPGHSGRKILINGYKPVAGNYYGSNDYSSDSSDNSQPVVQSNTPVSYTASNSSGSSGVSSADQPKASGITKNVITDTEQRSFLSKWFRTLFSGVPYAPDDSVTAFQVFPDYSGTSLNSQGNNCDQVLIYGRINAGSVCENNDVDVYGRRDSNNNIIASRIVNKASGTTVTPEKSIGFASAWIITLLIIAVIAAVCSAIGPTGIILVAALGLIISKLPKLLKFIGVVLLLFLLVTLLI